MYVECTHLNRLIEMILMSTLNITFFSNKQNSGIFKLQVRFTVTEKIGILVISAALLWKQASFYDDAGRVVGFFTKQSNCIVVST